MGDPRGGGPGDDVAAMNGVRLRRLGRQRIRRIRLPPELEDALAVDDHEQLLLGAVAMRWRAFRAGRQRDPVETADLRARLLARVLRDAAVVALEIGELDDSHRPWARLRPVEVRFPVERVLALADLSPRR